MLPLALVCLFVVSLFLFFTVSSGQLVGEKIRIINAADAAAYSAATVEARALNFSAHANRAIIANQVALAQALSLASWTNYFADLWINLDHATQRLGELIPPDDLLRWSQLQATLVGEAYTTAYGGADPRQIAQYVNNAAGVIVSAADLASQGLQLSEAAVRNSLRAAEFVGAGAQQLRLAQEAARIADPQVSLAIVPLSHGFDRFITLYDGSDRGRIADAVLRSRDDFSRERSWTLRNLLGFLGSKRFERSGTTTLADFDHWQATDELQYRSSGGLFGGSTRETVAAGWAVVGGAPQSASASAEYFLPGLFTGLPGIYDLRDTAVSDPRTGITVLATKPAAAARLRVGPGGRLAAFDSEPPGGGISALSRAEVFFERPDRRADGRDERGGTFAPYWRVRLVPPVAVDHLFAAGRQQGVVPP